jgi:hypothetical protein
MPKNFLKEEKHSVREDRRRAIMRAQVSLTVPESKKLIAKAVAKMDAVRNAYENGVIALHPSSSTIFIVEELLGKLPETQVWIMGMIVPKGACGSAAGRASHRIQKMADEPKVPRGPGGYSCTWVIEKGTLQSGIPLRDILDRMGPEDMYIKGVTAVDSQNNVGVLIGNLVEGGTIGLVMSRQKEKGFRLILPVGLEKLIPISIAEAAKEAAHRNELAYSMGMPCTLLPCTGTVVTELVALEKLTGVTAVPISAGGLGGAEGAVTLVMKGNDESVKKAIGIIEGLKGTGLPRKVEPEDCRTCETERCSLRGGNKPWI